MNADEVVVHVVKSESVDMIVELLRERVGQPGESAHVHAHRQVLPLDVRCAYEWIPSGANAPGE